MNVFDAVGNGQAEKQRRQERAQIQSVGLLTGTDSVRRRKNEIYRHLTNPVIRFG